MRLPDLLMVLVVITGVCQPAASDYTTAVYSTGAHVWEGWGTSLGWWANQWGTRDDLADIAFTKNWVLWNGKSLPGLGLNVVRYNIGGSGSSTTDGAASMRVSPNMPAFKAIQTYWLDWYSSDPSSSSWNWWVDSNQRNMVWKARDRGANLFEAFSDSPPWWMNYNHATAGGDDGSVNCLQSWNYGAFASYLATVVEYSKDHWGVTFNYIEPFNEPSETWWQFPSSQEGCHFGTDVQKVIIANLRAELDRRGLFQVGITAWDENSVDRALSTWTNLGATAQSSVAKINTHGYSGLEAYRGPNRGNLYAAASGSNKKLWMSEYGEADASGMTLADSISRDFFEMHPTAWVYWQCFDGGAWGLIQADEGSNWLGPPNPKYYVFAQYTRHIRPGMTILSAQDHNTVVAYDSARRVLVIVTVNFNNAGQWVTYDLSRFTGIQTGQIIPRWVTDTSGHGDLYTSHTSDTKLQSGKKFWSWFSPNTVQTFEVGNVGLL